MPEAAKLGPVPPPPAAGAYQPFPVLHTVRLRLREITPADAPALFRIHGDAEAMQWFGTDPLADLGAAHALVETFAAMRRAPSPGVRWGLVRTDDGQLIGSCGLMGWSRHTRSCLTGYELARSVWGQGYMREALVAAYGWGFQAMQLHRIGAQIHADNLLSQRLARGLGFVEEGVMRGAGYWGGRHHDLTLFSLLRHEFVPATAAEPS